MYYKKGKIVILQAEMNRLVSKDMDIINMLHADRAAGFRMLFDAYYMPLCLYSLQFTDDFDAAEDIVQSFFVHFWETRRDLLIGTQLYPYLFTAIHNNTLTYLKKTGGVSRMPEKVLNDDERLIKDLIEAEEHQDALRQREEQLYQALQTLSTHERQALEKTVIDEMSYKQVAAEMGISVNTLKTHLRRAMKKLRNSGLCTLLLLG